MDLLIPVNAVASLIAAGVCWWAWWHYDMPGRLLFLFAGAVRSFVALTYAAFFFQVIDQARVIEHLRSVHTIDAALVIGFAVMMVSLARSLRRIQTPTEEIDV